MKSRVQLRKLYLSLAIALTAMAVAGAGSSSKTGQSRPPPFKLPAEFVHESGDPGPGKEVFRFGTFGNQRFWTDAMRLPQGIAEAGVTPLQALQIGLSVNAEALNPATAQAALDAIAQIRAGTPPESTIFGDPAVTLALINQNAVIGVVAFDEQGERKPLGSDSNFDPDDTLDIAGGDKVGLTCAACHAVTDGSVLPPNPDLGTRGSIGGQVDGPSAHGLDVGAILAAAKNSLAYFPMLQLQFDALGGATIGRGDFPGLSVKDGEQVDVVALEAQADQYLTGSASSAAGGERFYPVGQFDAFPEGIGNPLHIAAFFATRLGAPWGIDGAIALLDDFNNTVFTVSLDPTSIAAPSGQEFLEIQAGAVGTEIAQDYRRVLEATGVTGFPFVEATDGLPPGKPGSSAGRRVDEGSLLNLNAYLDSLPSPRAPDDIDKAAAKRGREIFRTFASAGGGNCTTCHNVNPDEFVNPAVIPFEEMYPRYNESLVVIARRMGLAPIQNSGGATNLEGPSPFFDDRMIVLDGSRRGEPKGTSFPLLLDLVGKTSLLHDDEVRGSTFEEAADLLLDPVRGKGAAHPFFIKNPAKRADVVQFLRSLETRQDP